MINRLDPCFVCLSISMFKTTDWANPSQEVEDPKSFLARGQSCKRKPGEKMWKTGGMDPYPVTVVNPVLTGWVSNMMFQPFHGGGSIPFSLNEPLRKCQKKMKKHLGNTCEHLEFRLSEAKKARMSWSAGMVYPTWN